MSEARVPQELEEQAALYALGTLEQDDRRAFEVRLHGESLLLRYATVAYQTVTDALASAVAPVTPAASLRDRLVGRIAKETTDEAAQCEQVAGHLALGISNAQPRALLKERLLAHVAKEAKARPGPLSAFTFLRAADLEWIEASPGTFVKILFNDEVNHRSTVLCRMEPGSVYAPHRHVQTEEVYVLDGSCHCGGRLMHPGEYHRAEAGSVHPPTWTETGSLMLVMSSTQNEPLP